jgi:cell division protein FtsB
MGLRYKASCTRDQNAVFSHDQGVKKDTDTGFAGLIPRRRWQRMVQYLIVLVGCVLIVEALVGDKGVLQMLKKRLAARLLDQSVAAARAENARLRAEARRLLNDPAAIEDLARRDLGMIKRGEKLFIIRDAQPGDPPSGR